MDKVAKVVSASVPLCLIFVIILFDVKFHSERIVRRPCTSGFNNSNTCYYFVEGNEYVSAKQYNNYVFNVIFAVIFNLVGIYWTIDLMYRNNYFTLCIDYYNRRNGYQASNV